MKDHGPFAALFDAMDIDGDGKLYMKESTRSSIKNRWLPAVRWSSRSPTRVVRFLPSSTSIAIATWASGRSGGGPRALSWDRNNDGHIRSDEVPHHFQLSIGRGQVAVGGMANAMCGHDRFAGHEMPAPGPNWFRKMDRNRDGDISRREFSALGPISSGSTSTTMA